MAFNQAISGLKAAENELNVIGGLEAADRLIKCHGKNSEVLLVGY